ncbi:MAG: biotin/lipoyl-binding protein [Caldilineaceae bacterium]|nr:biotin/lipoyl-binding protein [Caldilineaceae bacterium]
MRYFVQVDGESWVVDIEEDAVLVNGEPVSLDLTQSGIPELYSVLLDGASHEVLVSSDVSGCDVTVGGQVLRAEVQDEPTRILMKGRGPVEAAGGALPVPAPISGLVVSVAVADGDTVEAGQILVVLEAMKMENDITAPRAGVVGQVAVADGDRVEINHVMLVLLEEEAAAG